MAAYARCTRVGALRVLVACRCLLIVGISNIIALGACIACIIDAPTWILRTIHVVYFVPCC
jgi:hypothetical protein